MLREEFTKIQRAADAKELLAETVHFTRNLGFETVSATVVVDQFCNRADFISIDNVPASYRPFFADHAAAKRDPVSQHCRRSGVPIAWGREVYIGAGCIDKWEERSRHGLAAGIALHLPKGFHFFIGVDRGQALPAEAGEVTRMAAELQLLRHPRRRQPCVFCTLLRGMRNRQSFRPENWKLFAGRWKAKPRGKSAAFWASASRRRRGI